MTTHIHQASTDSAQATSSVVDKINIPFSLNPSNRTRRLWTIHKGSIPLYNSPEKLIFMADVTPLTKFCDQIIYDMFDSFKNDDKLKNWNDSYYRIRGRERCITCAVTFIMLCFLGLAVGLWFAVLSDLA